MGGYGSGRRLPNPKTAVEDALTLRVRALRGLLRLAAEGRAASGVVTWSRGGRTTARAGVRAWAEGGAPRVRLTYTVTVRGRDPVDVALDVATTATPAGFGGQRLWLVCPGADPAGGCGRRVGTLHVPDGATRFACRECHGLTYRSRQESRKWDALFRRIGASVDLSAREVKRALSAGL